MSEETGHATKLKRGITPTLLLFFIIGDMVGGGIYALTGEVGAVVGGAIWAAFLLALVLAVFTAFSYAELVTKYPRAGGAAAYIHRAFRTPFLTFMITFAVVISGVTSASALAVAFAGEYLSPFFAAPKLLTGFILIVVLGLINFRGISESVKLNLVFTLIELVGLGLIVVVGIHALANGLGEPARALEFNSDGSIPMTILAGAALGFYALIGFEDSVNLAEETKNPSRAFPRALFGGILITGVIYMLVTVVAAMVVPVEQLAGSSGPLLEVMHVSTLGVPTKLFALLALFALFNGALINMIMASRLVYGMGDQGIMPGIFARIHRGRQTPWVAIVFTSIIAVGLVATGDISALASTTVTLLLLAFIAVNVAVMVLRRDPVEHEHFRTPLVLPVIGIIVCIGLLTQQSAQTWMRTGVLLGIGVLLFGVNAATKKWLDAKTEDTDLS